MDGTTTNALPDMSYQSIKTFEDACLTLDLDMQKVSKEVETLRGIDTVSCSRMLVAQYKLAIIRKALNGVDWVPNITVYCPCIEWYEFGEEYYKTEKYVKSTADSHKIGYIYDEASKKYFVIWGANYTYYMEKGFGFDLGVHNFLHCELSLLCCKSALIAQHLSKHFGRIIFDAIYGHYSNYRWAFE